MKNVFEYYDKTRNMGPNGLLVEVVEKYIKTGTVIDLGCGSGRDSIFLIDKRI